MTELNASLKLKLIDEVSPAARQLGEHLHAVGEAAAAGATQGAAAIDKLAAATEKAALKALQASGQMQTWREFNAQRMGGYMKSEGGHTGAIQRIAAEWGEYKQQMLQAGSATQAATQASAQHAPALAGEAAAAGRAGAAVDVLAAARERARQRAAATRASTAANAAALRTETAAAQQSAAAFAQLDAIVGRAPQRHQRLAVATRGGAAAQVDAAAASKAHTRGMAESVNMMTEMALGFGGLNPQIREFSTALAMGGNNAVTMGASMGPWGIALGLAAGVIPTLITQLAGASDEIDRGTRAVDGMTSAYDELRSTIQGMREAQRRERQAAAGRLTIDEQETELQTAQTSLAGARHDRNRLIAGISNRDLRARVEREDAQGSSATLDARVAELRTIIEAAEAGGQDAPAGVANEYGRLRGLSRRLRTSRTEIGSAQEQVRTAETALAESRRREREEEERQAREEAPGRTQRQIEDRLAVARTASGARLTEQQRSSLSTAMGRGRLTSAQRALLGEQQAGELDALRQQQQRQTEEAAQQRLDDVPFDERPEVEAEAASPVARVRRTVRRAARAASTAPSAEAAPAVDPRLVAALEQVARQRVDVRVSVDDERVRADVASSSAADMTGGQQ